VDWAKKYNITDIELIKDHAALMPKEPEIKLDTGKTMGGDVIDQLDGRALISSGLKKIK